MASVFIGSTSRDLGDYRQVAIKVCNELGLIPVAMEYFPAMGTGATEGSIRQLDKAAVYVGIFAHRYGFIEDGYKLSVTEMEFDYANDRHLERLCFLVDPSYPWPVDAIDFDNYARLKAFKDRINTTLIRSQFTTVENFKNQLTRALIEWKERHPTISPMSPSSKPPSTVNVSIAPPRPSLVIGREDDVKRLKSRYGLASDANEPDQIKGLTVVRGWPGVGKTTIVTSLAYDSDIAMMFPDGVLWAHLGEGANPYSELVAWGRALGLPDIDQTRTLEEAQGRLRATLANKQMFLIVDDAWKVEDAIPFKIAGPQCATLITTRFGDVARALAPTPDDVYVLGVLSDNKALELLQRLAPTVVKLYPEKSIELVRDLENLPLAIRVAGRMVENEATLDVGGVARLLDELSATGKMLEQIAPDDRFDPVSGTTPTINLLLKQSTDRLDEYTRERFALIGAFAPKPASFDRDAMKAVWLADDPLPTIRQLVDCGLLEPIVSTGRFQMHALLVMHAKSLLLE